MATKQFNSRIQWKKDTSANWTANNPVLLNGEIAIVITNAGETRFKVGDGTSSFTALPFQDEFLQDAITEVDDALLAHETNTGNPHAVTKSQVGLGNVDDVKQYSASNPPPYPVTSVNGETGAVSLSATDVGALPTTGGTMTGALTLSGNPSENLQAATKQYVDAAIAGIDIPESAQKYSGTLPTSGWTTSGSQSYYQVSISGMTEDKIILAIPQWSNLTNQPGAWSNLVNIKSYEGYVRFYAYSVPSVSINYTLIYY